MNTTAHTTAARLSAEDLSTAAQAGVARALAARQRLTEITTEQAAQVAGGAPITAPVLTGTQLVPGWWIYGQPAFSKLTQPQIVQGINVVKFR